MEDVEAQLVVGGVDVGDQPPCHAAEDAVLDAFEVLGTERSEVMTMPLPGADDLIHRVEELFLRRLLAGDELDVVDHQQVDRAQPLLEG